MQPSLFHLSQMRNEVRQRLTLGEQHATQTLQQLLIRQVSELPEAIPVRHDGSIQRSFSSLTAPRRRPIACVEARGMQIIANAAHIGAQALREGIVRAFATLERLSAPEPSTEIAT
jgi:hypothetical protein